MLNGTTGRVVAQVPTWRGQPPDVYRFAWYRCFAWSPDSRYLAATNSQADVIIFEAATGREEFILQGHKGPITAAAWSHDGQRLASGCDDGSIKVWDVAAQGVVHIDL